MSFALLILGPLAAMAGPVGAEAADDWAPATSNVPGAEYPRVHTDLRVTFRVRASGAQKVRVIPGGDDNGLGRGPFEMTQGEGGVWTVTTPPEYDKDPAVRVSGRRNEAFGDLVIQDLIPMIDAAYRTIPDRTHRAIAGLSMGAGQATQIGLGHLDRFAYIGAFSGGRMGSSAVEPSSVQKLFWMGAGSLEAVWFEVPGTAHEWQTWRVCLYEFAPRLFRE